MVETQSTLLKRGYVKNKRTMASPSFSYLLTYLEARDFSRVRLHIKPMSDVIGAHVVDSPFLGSISIKDLLGGVKTLILMGRHPKY